MTGFGSPLYIALVYATLNDNPESLVKSVIGQPEKAVIELLRKTHWLADGMKATDSECDDRMLAINP